MAIAITVHRSREGRAETVTTIILSRIRLGQEEAAIIINLRHIPVVLAGLRQFRIIRLPVGVAAEGVAVLEAMAAAAAEEAAGAAAVATAVVEEAVVVVATTKNSLC